MSSPQGNIPASASNTSLASTLDSVEWKEKLKLARGVVLPRPPNDKLKVAYLSTNKAFVALCVFFSTAAFITGIILFMYGTNNWWYWIFSFIGVFASMVTYFIVIVLGRGFDFDTHDSVIKQVRDNTEDPFAPSVDILLPVCGEDLSVLQNTWSYVSKIRHNGTLKVYVLDDSDSPDVKELSGFFGFHYLVRDNRPHMKKAGNLRSAFTKTDGEFFVIFDADFCPRPDFLEETLGRMKADPTIAIFQTPQFFEQRKEQNYVEKGAGAVQELFYRLIQPARNSARTSLFSKYTPAHGAICVGSCAVYRRAALEPFGGTAEVEHSEDVRTGFMATSAGYHVEYAPINLATGVCPTTQRAFFSQQYRWASGSTTLGTSKVFWETKLGAVRRISYMSGMMFYLTSLMSIITGPIISQVLIWAYPKMILYYNISFAIPGIILIQLLLPIWSAQLWPFSAFFSLASQNWAYTWAIKDRLLGTVGQWSPTGNVGKKSQMSIKFRNARMAAFVVVFGTWISMFTGAFLQMFLWNRIEWFNVLPMMAITSLHNVMYIPFIFNI
ncbi:cellulose synthase catalytic subunit (UDP-forming) [Acanthocystis turfacea Chlorella virus MO0605SPH]|nr:cellulose synthase catalytic subunit (UDP-forming) [Acanthocystis turfacea Chlorella virus MO0605SPH]